MFGKFKVKSSFNMSWLTKRRQPIDGDITTYSFRNKTIMQAKLNFSMGYKEDNDHFFRVIQ